MTDNELDWLLNKDPEFNNLPDNENDDESEEEEEIIAQSDHDTGSEQEYESDTGDDSGQSTNADYFIGKDGKCR